MTKKHTIKQPILVLNNATKFYLATHEVNPEDPSDWFFYISLFYPVKNGKIIEQPQTEIVAFDDAKSAAVYYETLRHFCEFNAKNQKNKTSFPFIKDHIENFYKLAKEKVK